MSERTGDEGIDEVFRALADPSRRRLLDSLNARNGQSLRELCAGLDMTRQSVSKHLAILEAANLVTTRRQGREKLHYLNAEPINAIAERWISQYHRERVHALADLKTALEQPMSSTDFVYTSYIATTPEKLWQALTDPAFTSRYWGATFTSDWTAGSSYTWHQFGVTIDSPEMVVLESEPYRRLSYTWHDFTPELRREGRDHRRVPGHGGRRAAVEGDVRDRARRAAGQAHRRPRRVRARQHRAQLGQPRLAGHPVQPEDAAGDR